MSDLVTENLPLVTTAPNGIKRLRGLILELAVRGKLVPQDPTDEPASELLKRIEGEKARLVKEGKIRKSKAVNLPEEWAMPLATPNGWQWASLAAVILDISSGGTPSKTNSAYWGGDIPWASVKDLGIGEPLTTTRDRITKAGLKAGSFLARAGSVLVCTRMGLGKIGQAKIDVAINQDLKALRLPVEIDAQYFINFFKTLSIKGSGMTVAGIKQDELLRFPIPIPPLPEQHRIVARVDELMALCDRLDAEQTDATEAHARLVDALLATLTTSRDPAECAANWQRLSEHFDTLFTTEASIAALKQTVLQLAVMGRLVPQDPIEGTKVEGRFSDFAAFLNGYAFKSSWFTKGGVRLVRNTNVGHGGCNWKDAAYITHDQAREFEKFALFAGDLVLSLDRPIITSGLKIAWISEQDTPCMLLQRVAMVVPSPIVDLEYLYLWFNSPLFIESIDPGRSNGVPHISTKEVLALTFVCPPLPEQHRILAKVDELMTLCDRLQTDLQNARASETRIAEALTTFG